MKYNVYDFDKTIYKGDSAINFYLFCIKKNPIILLKLPKVMISTIQYKFHRITKKVWKEQFYSFLLCCTDIDILIEKFWEKNINKMTDWYLLQKNENDIIISASPEFLLKPVCTQIGIQNVICSLVDKNSGKYYGENCYGKEKVRRLLEKFPNCEIENFYSDSLSDFPLTELAKQSYIVKKYKKLYKWK